MRGTILHFTTELGENAAGGVGTYIHEMRRAADSNVGFVLLSESMTGLPAAPDVIRTGFYDMDVLNRLPFDAAVFHFYGLAYLAHPSFLRGRRLIFTVHSVPTTEPWSAADPYGGSDRIARSFEALCDQASHIVCVSEAERGKLLLIYPDLEWKTSVIPNGLSSLSIRPCRIHSEGRTFGFLGRCDYRKGLRELLLAFQSVEGSLRIACGHEDERYRKEAEADAERYGLSGRVEWLGRIDGENKSRFFDSLDALVVPSRWEPFGYVALEALRSGIPPLISSQGGMPEITGSSYRYQFDPYDPVSIARCMQGFQHDSEAIVRRELETALTFAGRLTAERMAEAYAKLALEDIDALPPVSPINRSKRYGESAAGDSLLPILGFPGSASATPPHQSLHKPLPPKP